MSIIIRGMEMPKNCMLCSFCVEEADPANGEMCLVTGELMPPCNHERLDDCPLIEVPEWIPVAERLPKEKGNYLVVQDCGHGAEVHEAFFFKYFDSWGWYDPVEEYQEYNPTHWMPLPKPPKDGET